VLGRVHEMSLSDGPRDVNPCSTLGSSRKHPGVCGGGPRDGHDARIQERLWMWVWTVVGILAVQEVIQRSPLVRSEL